MMKQEYDGKGLQDLVNLGREQGYLTFDQVNNFPPQSVASPDDLRAVLESLEGRAEAETEPEEDSVDDFSESSDPVRLYLKEMGQFQLLTRVGEVEVLRRLPGQRPASSAPLVAVDLGWSGAAAAFGGGGLETAVHLFSAGCLSWHTMSLSSQLIPTLCARILCTLP